MHNFEQKVHDFIIENNMFEKSAPIIVGLSAVWAMYRIIAMK